MESPILMCPGCTTVHGDFVEMNVLLQSLLRSYLPADRTRRTPVYFRLIPALHKASALIQESTKNMLLSTSLRLYQGLDEAGLKPVNSMYEFMVHVSQQLPIPETEHVIGKTAHFLAQCHSFWCHVSTHLTHSIVERER